MADIIVPKQSVQPTEPPVNNNKRQINNDDYELSDDCLSSITSIVNLEFGVNSYDLNTECISICGENSYGAILELEIIPKKLTKTIINNKINNDNNNSNNNSASSASSLSTSTETIIPSTNSESKKTNKSSNNNNNKKKLVIKSLETPDKRMHLIAKLSPKKLARRKAMKVVQYYEREVFMYRKVLSKYKQIQINDNIKINLQFNSPPLFYDSSLKTLDEYLILEDLIQKGYSRYSRQKVLTYEHCNLALIELAKFHSMSYVLRERNKNLYYKLVDEIRYDNLFSDDIEPISIEFGRRYLNKTIDIIREINNDEEKLFHNKDNILKKLTKIIEIFHELCVELVDGEITEPYSVICHGDFWNNNILYKYDNKTGLPIEAKVIDYQMARFSSPILDFVHYLFACTEKSLRDKHFNDFKNTYYNTLESHLKLFQLDANKIFSRYMFETQLKSHGIYGFCMAIYAMPFFISDNSDIPDLDEVSEAIVDIANENSAKQVNGNTKTNKSTSNSTNKNCNGNKSENNCKPTTNTDVLKNYEMLNERTYPIYRKRMIGIVQDLEKYDLLNSVMLFKHKYANLCVLK